MSRQYSSKTAARILCALFVLISAAVAAAGPVESVQAQAPAQQQTGGVTDTWAVQISPGADPDQLALQMGAQNLGQIGALTDYYLFRIPGTDSELTAMADVFAANSQVVSFQQQVARQQSKRVIEDPVYLDQWHLVKANVEPAWNAGFTGTGVTIAIVDDGLEYAHPDIGGNYKPLSSWDFTTYGVDLGDSDPAPASLSLDYHGTPVAGLAAADNDGLSCGVGVAYDAGLSGIRLVPLPTTDAQEAAALGYRPDLNSIYNNSWGPLDDMTEPLVGPGPLTLAALQKGVTTGRNGKGSIYVWAAGNGLLSKDNVNYDGYANSRFTIAVGAVGNDDTQASYSEPGAAMLVTAPGGNRGPNGIVTTDLLGHFGESFNTDCTEGNFDGTSASAPIVSGVVALMLQANPSLGWRDVQNILARTAVQNDPTDTETIPDPIDPVNAPPITVSTWVTNGAGLHVNHKYGFGLVDAAAAVAMANPATYINLRLPSSISSGTIPVNQEIPDLNADPYGDGIVSEFVVTRDITLEHVEVVFNASAIACTLERPDNCGGFRGDLKVVLISPSGVQSVLSEWHDDPENDYVGWKFMTVRDWGESSLGTWTLKVTDTSGVGFSTFDSWQLILHGTGKDVFSNASLWTGDFSYYPQGWRADLHPRVMGDVNGDRKDDVIGFGYGGILVGLSNGTGFEPAANWTADYSYNQGWRMETYPRMVGDVNGDGMDDVVGFGYAGAAVALSNGSGFDSLSLWTSDFSYYPQGWRANMHPREMGDVNGDGMDDVIGFGYGGILVGLSNGTGFDPAVNWTADYSYNQGWRMETYPRMVGDVNGDGMEDVVGFGYAGAVVALSNGSGFDPLSLWTSDFSYYPQGWRANLHPRVMGDVNGDGMDDVIGFGYGGVLVGLSNGSGFNPATRWTDDYSYNQGWRMDTYPRMVGDVNGDGMDDLVGFGYAGALVAIAQ